MWTLWRETFIEGQKKAIQWQPLTKDEKGFFSHFLRIPGLKIGSDTVAAGFNESLRTKPIIRKIQIFLSSKKIFEVKTDSLNLDDSLKPNSLNPASSVLVLEKEPLRQYQH